MWLDNGLRPGEGGHFGDRAIGRCVWLIIGLRPDELGRLGVVGQLGAEQGQEKTRKGGPGQLATQFQSLAASIWIYVDRSSCNKSNITSHTSHTCQSKLQNVI